MEFVKRGKTHLGVSEIAIHLQVMDIVAAL
jgi:hypothetical protein